MIKYYLKAFTFYLLFMNEIGGTNRDNILLQDFWQELDTEGELATAILKKNSLKQRLNFLQPQNFKKYLMLYWKSLYTTEIKNLSNFTNLDFA